MDQTRRRGWGHRPSRIELLLQAEHRPTNEPPASEPDDTPVPDPPGRPVLDIALDAIIVGARHRTELGDLDGLADSMTTIGLLQPVVITPERRLVAGGRRLEAARRVGWTTIPAVVAGRLDETADLLRAERDENTCRKEMTIEERVNLGRAIEAAEASRAAARMHAGARPSGNFPEGPGGETRELVGAAIGMSGRTYNKAKEIIEATELDPDDPDTEQVRAAALAALDELRRTGKVDGAHRKVRTAKGRTPLVVVDHPGQMVETALRRLEPVLMLSPSTALLPHPTDPAGLASRLDHTICWLSELYELLLTSEAR
jgi:hypothetical protein